MRHANDESPRHPLDLAAVTTFSVMDVLLKTLSEDCPAMQVTFLRGAASLPLLLGANAVFGRWRDLLPKRWLACT